MNADVEGHRGPLPGVFLGDYGGALRRIVLSAKHSVRTDLGEFLDDAGENLGVRACEVLGIGKASERDAARESRPSGRDPRTEVWVVPAPSSWKRRMRGRQVPPPLLAVSRRVPARAHASRSSMPFVCASGQDLNLERPGRSASWGAWAR